ncbi:MAG: hypothetical protein H6672_16770 [Anaerolineaceae bacterium]|nr:hypothetical protein [Anaerolineaceae bacterium]
MTWMKFEVTTFALDIPSTWLVKATPQFQAMFIGKKQDDEPIFPSLTIAIMISKDDLPTYFNQIAQVQTTEYPDYQIMDETHGPAWIERSYRWQYPGVPERLIQRQRFYIDRNNIYTLTMTYLPSQTNATQETFAVMLNSFEFI